MDINLTMSVQASNLSYQERLDMLLDKEISPEMIELTEKEYITITLMHLIRNQACSVCFALFFRLDVS